MVKKILKKAVLVGKKKALPKAGDPLVGQMLPSLTLESTLGRSLEIPKDLSGKWTLLYFYPRDNTPGCTKQACNYRDDISRFKKLGIQILGVSADSLASHEKFKNKFDLNFPLISDSQKKLAQELKVFRNKTLYGRVFKGINRDTFLVDPDGVIRQVWRKVNPKDTVIETFDEARRFVKGTS